MRSYSWCSAVLAALSFAACQRDPADECRAPRVWHGENCLMPCGGDLCFGDGGVAVRDALDAGTTDASVDAHGTDGRTADAVVCTAPSVMCGTACTNPATDPNHCGACGRVCPGGVNARATCEQNACGIVCLDGYEQSPQGCMPRVPRLIAPLSTNTVTSQTPRLRWEQPMGLEGVRIELCRTRACDTMVRTIDATGSSTVLTEALTPGVWFWRVRGRGRGVISNGTSATWQFTVGHRSAMVNASHGGPMDANGDGLADMVIGAPRATVATLTAAGEARAYFGARTGLASTPSQTLAGTSANEEFARALANAGDVNGDGFTDLLVGTPKSSPAGRTEAGTVRLYTGSASGFSPTALSTVQGAVAGEHLGAVVSGAGDVNGDGYADVLIASPDAAPGGRAGAGRVQLFYGSASGLRATAAFTVEGRTAGEKLGSALAGGGDLDGDGFADVAVGAPLASGAMGAKVGAVHVLFGSSAGIDATRSFRTGVDAPFARFGSALTISGDVSGDGYSDLLIGAPYEGATTPADGGDPGGMVYWFRGAPTGLIHGVEEEFLIAASAGSASRFGESIALLGDINADGFDDLWVGDPASYEDAFGVGQAFLIYGTNGGISRWTETSTIWENTGDGANLAVQLAGIGDFDGSGQNRAIATAPANSFVVIAGRNAMTSRMTEVQRLSGVGGEEFGAAIAAAQR